MPSLNEQNEYGKVGCLVQDKLTDQSSTSSCLSSFHYEIDAAYLANAVGAGPEVPRNDSRPID